MTIPVQVSFKEVPVSDAVESAAWGHAAGLERVFGRITGCRVVVAAPQHRGRKGRLYSVRIDLTVPGEEIVINRQHRFSHAHEDVYVAMRDAFDAARRRLRDHARRVRGGARSRAGARTGRVRRIAPEGNGFIATPEGREIDFRRNALAGAGFERLAAGDPASFTEKAGLEGLRASSVRVRRPARGPRASEAAA